MNVGVSVECVGAQCGCVECARIAHVYLLGSMLSMCGDGGCVCAEYIIMCVGGVCRF